MNVVFGWQLAAVLVLLVVAAAVVVGVGRLGSARPVVTAALRAVGQLAAVSFVIVLVLNSGWLTAGFVVFMFVVAAWTSAGRTTARHGYWAAVPIAGGVAPILALLLVTGVVPRHPLAIIPIAGIAIGGAMTATSLAGRRALDELVARRGEYEAALALGFTNPEAVRLIVRPTAGQAFMPVLDQTRTVGLVTLPGAFVGILLGGGTPLQAGTTQLLVLIALLAIEAVAVLITVELVAAERLIPAMRP